MGEFLWFVKISHTFFLVLEIPNIFFGGGGGENGK